MKLIQTFFTVHLLTAVAALAIGYAVGGYINWAFVIILFGGLWYFAHLRGAQGLETLLFFGYALAAAVGFWVQLAPLAMLVAMVAALGAWDLDHFSQRVRLVERAELTSGLNRNHLRRLAIIEGLGLLAGLAALTSSLQIPFWTELLLVILAVYGISRMVIVVKNTLG